MTRSRVVLTAKAAVAAAPAKEMARLAAWVEGLEGVEAAAFAFTEQGQPSLREVLGRLAAEGGGEILVVPLLLPEEPSYRAWLQKSIQRWRTEAGGDWPPIRIGPAPGESEALLPLLAALVDAARAAEVVPEPNKPHPAGSVVPRQKRRVLVCLGGPCNEAGAAVIWGHLRNRQTRDKLAEAGEGMTSAKASCLGPCSLAPVLQVYPEGVVYGGVDEAGLDRIIDEHLLGGRVVEDLAYPPGEGKQTLRRS